MGKMSKMLFDKWKVDLLERAMDLQQSFYEEFKNLNIYAHKDGHVQLKNHIGVTLFGPPGSEKHKNEFICTTSGISDNLYFQTFLHSVTANFTSVTSTKEESSLYNYRSDQLEVINSIYAKVVEHGTEPETNFVYCGNVYKIICENTKVAFENLANENKNVVRPIPLFRIQKHIKIGKIEAGKRTQRVGIEESEYEIQDWFIDNQGKVYESWIDYLESDKSLNYAIVYPKDGIYQVDLRKKISKDFDPVWIEVRPSLEEWRADLLETATTVQQSFYEMLSDFNSYSSKELLYLKNNIAYALFGLPELEKNEDKTDAGTYLQGVTNIVTNLRGYLFGDSETTLISTSDEKESDALELYNSYNDNQKQTVDSIFKIIVPSENSQPGEKSDVYYCGIIYNVIYDDSEENYQRIFKKFKKKDGQDSQSTSNHEEENDQKGSEGLRYEILYVDFHGTVYMSLDDPAELKNANAIFPVPLFKIKKNIKIEEGSKDEKESQKSSSEEDRYSFIDAEARVYDNWDDYITYNTLPKCTMIFPKNGVYQANPEKQNSENFTSVWVESQLSPASNRTIAQVIDTVTGIIGGVGLGICAVGLVTPVAPFVAVTAGISTGVTALWGAGRSAQKLKDRSDHRQSIWLDNKDSIVAWLGIAGCAVGAAASGSGVILSRAAQRGVSVGRLAKSTYDAIVVGNLAVNGAGIVYRAHELIESYRTNKQIDALEIVFLSAHLLFFYNTMVNIKFAQTIVETEQQKVLKAIEDSLRSNRHRKEYARLVRNTSKLGSSWEATNEEIIRSFQKIENKDEFLATMVRNRKTFSKVGAKAAFVDGKVQINGEVVIDANDFAKLSKAEVSNIIENNQVGGSNTSSQSSPVPIETIRSLPNAKQSNFGVNNTKKPVVKSKEQKVEGDGRKNAGSRENVKLNQQENENSRVSANKGTSSSGNKSNPKSNENHVKLNEIENENSRVSTPKGTSSSGNKSNLKSNENHVKLNERENGNSRASTAKGTDSSGKKSNVKSNENHLKLNERENGNSRASTAKGTDSSGKKSNGKLNKNDVKLNEVENGNYKASAGKSTESTGKKSNVKSNEISEELNLKKNKSLETSKAKEPSGKKAYLQTSERKMELKATQTNKSLLGFVLSTSKALSQIDLDKYLRILRHFCSQENAEVPNVNEFMNVLRDIQSFDNSEEIFQKLLKAAHKFGKKVKLSNVLSNSLRFLWAKIKVEIKNSYWNASDDLCKNVGSEIIQKFVIKCLDDIYVEIERKGDEYVNEFLSYVQEILENWEKDKNENLSNEVTVVVNPQLPYEGQYR